jgi:hypothetical protein
MLERVYPAKFNFLNHSQLEGFIAEGRRCSMFYGLTNGRDVQKYTGLMMLLGSNFDKDPLFPWATLDEAGNWVSKWRRDSIDIFCEVDIFMQRLRRLQVRG